MTLLNFALTKRRALIATDTLGGNGERQLHVNKLFPVPHARLVVCGRGSLGLISQAARICSVFKDLDDARTKLPSELKRALFHLKVQAWLFGLPKAILNGPQEVYLIGWSPSELAIVALRFGKLANQKDFTVEDDIYESIAPALGEEKFPPMDDTSKMMDIARSQVEQYGEGGCNETIGGRLVTAEVTRDAIMIQRHGEIALPAQSEKRGQIRSLVGGFPGVKLGC